MEPIEAEPDADVVFASLCKLLPAHEGFECYQFKIGSYNAVVEQAYRLPYHPNSFATIVLNTPRFFEKTLRPWLQSQRRSGEEFQDFAERFGDDILRQYFSAKFAKVQQELLPIDCDVIHDFEFNSDGSPKIIMTTCGHVAGAAYFYLPMGKVNNNNNITPSRDPFIGPPARPMGLSLHSKYGGHFAFRAVLIFPKICLPESFLEAEPKMVLDTVGKQMEAVEMFNFHWRDGRFRDYGCSGDRYSDLQVKFYSVPPAERWPLLKHWFC